MRCSKSELVANLQGCFTRQLEARDAHSQYLEIIHIVHLCSIAAVCMSLLLLRGSWKDADFKPYNFNALGQPTNGGHLHPLLKVDS